MGMGIFGQLVHWVSLVQGLELVQGVGISPWGMELVQGLGN